MRIVERPVCLEPDRSYELVVAKRSRGGILARGARLGRQIRTKTQFVVRSGDFLISRRQIVHGACGIVPPGLDGAIVSNEYTALRTNDCLRPAFLELLAATPYLQRTFYHSSVGVHVEKMVFREREWLKYPVHCPPVREQEEIVRTLGKWETAVLLAERLSALARTRKAALMQQLLAGSRRFGGLERQTWRPRRLGDVASLQSGIAKGGKQFSDPVERPYLRVANVLDGELDLSHIKTITVERAAVARYELCPGDVLMNEGGATGQLGRGAVWQGQIEGCLHQNHVYAVRPDPAVLLPEFLAAWAMSSFGRRYFQRCAKQSTIATLDSKQLLGAEIMVPGVEEQAAITGLLAALNREVVALTALSAALDRERRGVAELLLTGKARVPEALS